jgi:hypothetical protein
MAEQSINLGHHIDLSMIKIKALGSSKTSITFYHKHRVIFNNNKLQFNDVQYYLGMCAETFVSDPIITTLNLDYRYTVFRFKSEKVTTFTVISQTLKQTTLVKFRVCDFVLAPFTVVL